MNLMLKNRENDRDMVDDLDRLQREFANFFGFDPFLGVSRDAGLLDRTFAPAVDLIETNDGYVLYADLPGVERKDLELSVENNLLSLTGEKKEAKEEKEGKSFFRKETWSGKFRRTVALPPAADPEKVKAELKDGVLQVSVGKREELKPRRISVNAQ